MADDTALEIAYIAGLFDGEGCVVTLARGQSCNVFPQIAMTDPRPLHRVHAAFGGYIRVLPPRPSRRQAWSWYVYGAGATRFFAAVLPHLLAKRDEAALALALKSLIRTTKKGVPQKLTQQDAATRLSLMRDIRALKRREFEVT